MNNTKTYKDFPTIYLGDSDTASLTVTGFVRDSSVGEHITAKVIFFGGDSSYRAYLVKRAKNEPVEIGAHYSLVASFNSWAKVYDDEGYLTKLYGDEIKIYRAGDYGCVIEVVNND